MEKDSLFTVGELAKRCGITVRTLQFYDSSGLVSPSSHSEGGRRLYGMRDILRLQQVMFLKSFGFSLDEIRDRLLTVQSASALKDMLMKQYETLEEQIKFLMSTSSLIKKTVSEIERSGDIPLANLMAIMSAVQQGHSFSFVLKYFGQKEMEGMVGNLVNRPNPFGVADHWQGMIDRLLILHRQGVDPEGEEGQIFAAEWWSMIEDITQNNPDILKSALSAGADVENWPDDANEFKTAIRDFVGTAIAKYVKDNGISLP